MALLELKDLSKRFDNGLEALREIHLKIEKSEFLSILGPSGCGKSTLLRLIAGLEAPTMGQIKRERENLKVAYVFQEAQLLPWKNVFENVALPLRLLKNFRELDVKESLDLVGLTDFKSAYPRQLSGGMKMRVSLARALVTKPELLLLDEPFAALDELTRFRLDSELRKIWSETQCTILFVTHSLNEALFLSDRILRLSSRPGRLLEDRRLSFPPLRDPEFRAGALFNQELLNLQKQMEIQE